MEPADPSDGELGEGADVGPFALIGETSAGTEARRTADPGSVRARSSAPIRFILCRHRIGASSRAVHHVLIREENEIGDDVSIGTGTVVNTMSGSVTAPGYIPRPSSPNIPFLRRACWIGPMVVLTNAKYPNRPDTKKNLRGGDRGAKRRHRRECHDPARCPDRGRRADRFGDRGEPGTSRRAPLYYQGRRPGANVHAI